MGLLTTAASGISAQQIALDTTANNLANVSTPGFKAGKVSFEDALAEQEYLDRHSDIGPIKPDRQISVGSGALVGSTILDQTQGALISSDSPLDMAIDGNGFFEVVTPQGQTALTRAGMFRTDGSGQLVDELGNKVKIQPAFTIPSTATNLSVDAQGKVSGVINGKNVVFGHVVVATVANPMQLQSMGDNLFAPTAGSGNPVMGQPGSGGVGLIRSNAIEQSNVDMASSMNDLIQAQRAYQLNVRVMQDGDQMWGIANSLRR